MHVEGLFKKKHNTLRKKRVFGQGYFCSIYMFTTEKESKHFHPS